MTSSGSPFAVNVMLKVSIALLKRAHIQTGWGGGGVEIKNVTDLSLQDAAKALAMLRLLGAINKTPVSK